MGIPITYTHHCFLIGHEYLAFLNILSKGCLTYVAPILGKLSITKLLVIIIYFYLTKENHHLNYI